VWVKTRACRRAAVKKKDYALVWEEGGEEKMPQRTVRRKGTEIATRFVSAAKKKKGT